MPMRHLAVAAKAVGTVVALQLVAESGMPKTCCWK
jgi:hypothetical protein